MALVALRQTVIFAILMGVGALSRKFGLLNDERDRGLTALLLNIVSPCVIIVNLGKNGLEEYRSGLLLAMLLSVIIYAAYFVAVPLLVPKRDSYDYQVARFACIYPNSGFMGIPLVMAILGSEGVIYVVAMVLIFNLLAFTQGVNSYQRDKGSFDLKLLLQPAVVSCGIGMIFFFTPLSVPAFVMEPMQMLADMNSPLAMLIVGSSLAQIDFKNITHKGVIAMTSLYRLVLLPLVAVLICRLVPGDLTVKTATIIIYACPAANLALIFGIKYKRDTLLASELVAVTTVLSIFTIPLIAGIGQMVIQ